MSRRRRQLGDSQVFVTGIAPKAELRDQLDRLTEDEKQVLTPELIEEVELLNRLERRWHASMEQGGVGYDSPAARAAYRLLEEQKQKMMRMTDRPLYKLQLALEHRTRNVPRCPVCLTDFIDPVKLDCGHEVCAECLTWMIQSRNHRRCPHCTQFFTWTLDSNGNLRKGYR